MNLKLWFRATRFHIVLSGSSPFFVAIAFAYYNNHTFNFLLFFLEWLAMTAFLISTNLFNDYYDHLSKADDLNPSSTHLSGGSRVIQQGLVSEKTILYGSIASLLFASIIGLYLNFILDGVTLLLLGVLGFFIIYFYAAPPIKLNYRGLGEIAQTIGYGPVIIFGAYYVQTKVISREIILFSIPVTLFGLIIGTIVSIPDYEADKKVKKRNLVVILGKEKTVIFYGIILALIFIFDALLLYSAIIPLWSSIVFILVPFAVLSIVNAFKNRNNTILFLRTSNLTLLIAALHNYLFVIILILSSI
jgi:1,4-dihydroxy-2-naphthoate octaprenyltransferase